MTECLDAIYTLALGASLALWFAYYVLGAANADLPAVITGLVWAAALFSKMWLLRKTEVSQNG
jgi:hypothetical protein